jgi:hypothetical protein
MIRNLKVLLLAGLAVVAFGALNASMAQASGEQYHCSVTPCKVVVKPDGAVGSKTAHHVFDFKVNAGNLTTVTCNQLSGHGTSSTATTTELTITELKYLECNVGGQAATTNANGCHYLFTAGTEGTVHVQCPAGASIQVTFGTCVLSVGAQTLSGIKYHNVGTEVTVESLVTGIHGTTTAGCPGGAGTFTTGEYTTGNSFVTGQTDPGGVMATVFYE